MPTEPLVSPKSPIGKRDLVGNDPAIRLCEHGTAVSADAVYREDAARNGFFDGAAAGMAEMKLQYALEAGHEVALLVGDAGLGKSTVLRHIAGRLRQTGQIVVDVFYPQLSANQLLCFIDGELRGPESATNSDPQAALRRIAGAVDDSARQNRSIVILIDDAHLMVAQDVLETLRCLLNLRRRESARLMIILAGEMPLLANLSQVPALESRVGVRAILDPFDLDETREYLSHRMRIVVKRHICWQSEAFSRFHEMTWGNPRRVDRVADMAILLAESNGRETVTLADLDNLASELGVPFPAG